MVQLPFEGVIYLRGISLFRDKFIFTDIFSVRSL